jgi:SAM-dependent methyltransferase
MSGQTVPWVRVMVRPVSIKAGFRYQFSYFDQTKNVVKNYPIEDARQQLDELLDMPFRNIAVVSTDETFQLNVTKKGKEIVSTSPNKMGTRAPNLAHDRQKPGLLHGDDAAAFLKAVGIMSDDGRIKADRYDKYRQINEFMAIVHAIVEGKLDGDGAVNVVDFGCGNAYLTFAAYYYVRHILKRRIEMVGVDVQQALLDRHAASARELGWDTMRFAALPIADFESAASADIVLALHACDTATDDALARGARWGSTFMFAAPCCQHDIQQQLDARGAPEAFAAVMRHGILGQRLGDILTDALRAAILRILGYRTEVIQFVDTEHTAKNVMIRAEKTGQPGNPRAVQEYLALKQMWGVTPRLEVLLSGELPPHLGALVEA